MRVCSSQSEIDLEASNSPVKHWGTAQYHLRMSSGDCCFAAQTVNDLLHGPCGSVLSPIDHSPEISA